MICQVIQIAHRSRGILRRQVNTNALTRYLSSYSIISVTDETFITNKRVSAAMNDTIFAPKFDTTDLMRACTRKVA